MNDNRKKITMIIKDVWNQEHALDDDLENFDFYISSIMCYGYTEEEVRQYAKDHNINIDDEEYDLDDEIAKETGLIYYVTKGALCLNQNVIDNL